MELVERTDRDGKVKETLAWQRIVNSTLASILAFVLIYFGYLAITAFIAKRYALFNKLYYFKVEFTSTYDNWQLFPVRITFSTGVFICLGFAILAYVIQRNVRKQIGMAKFVWLWLFVHAFNMSVAQLILMPMAIRSKGGNPYMAIFANYMRWDDFVKLIISVVSSLLLVLIGIMAAKPFVQTANSTNLIARMENRLSYLFQIVFLPYVISSIFCYIFFIDGLNILNIALPLTLLVVVFSIFITALRDRMIMVYRLPEPEGISKPLVIALFSILIFLKLVFDTGARF